MDEGLGGVPRARDRCRDAGCPRTGTERLHRTFVAGPDHQKITPYTILVILLRFGKLQNVNYGKLLHVRTRSVNYDTQITTRYAILVTFADNQKMLVALRQGLRGFAERSSQNLTTRQLFAHVVPYRGTSLIRNCPPPEEHLRAPRQKGVLRRVEGTVLEG